MLLATVTYVSRPLFPFWLFPPSFIRKLQLCSTKAVSGTSPYLSAVFQELTVKVFNVHLHVD